MKNQPKALFLLCFVSMWECFSYYGMRALLVLFLTQELLLGDANAIALFALYTTLVEFGGVIGGTLADKVLTLKRSMVLGSLALTLGHSLLFASHFFYLGLGLIVVGTSLFRSNCAAYLGEFYEENDSRREAGFTLYYAGINVGGLIATLLCGFTAEAYGWHAGFGLAAIGMLTGTLCLMLGGKYLSQDKRLKKRKTALTMLAIPVAAYAVAFLLENADTVFPYLPLAFFGAICFVAQKIRHCTPEQKNRFMNLGHFIALLIFFYAAEELLGSTLVLYTLRIVDKGVFPAGSIALFNPLTILIAGPIVLRLFAFKSLRKMAVGFTFLTISFTLLYLSTYRAEISLGFPILSIICISLGEILIGPTVLSEGSKAASKGLEGMTMSFVTLGFAFANFLSGHLSQWMAVEEGANAVLIYRNGFSEIALIGLLITVALIMLQQRKQAVAVC